MATITSLERLDQRLESELPSLLLIVGDEPLTAQEATDAWKRAGESQGYTERYAWTQDARSSWHEIEMTWASDSLFGARFLLQISIPSGKPGSSGAAFLEKLARRPQPDKKCLVMLPSLDYRTRQSAWFKSLESAATLLEAQPVPRSRMTNWLARRLGKQQRGASDEALEFLADCTEGNLLAASQEIDKLCLLYQDLTITLDQVQSSVMMVNRLSLTQLQEALAARELSRACLTLRHLRDEGEALPLILWSLCEDWRILILLTSPAGKTQAPRLWGERKARLGAMARWSKTSACIHALERAAELDRMIKGLIPGDPWEELLHMMLEFLAC